MKPRTITLGCLLLAGGAWICLEVLSEASKAPPAHMSDVLPSLQNGQPDALARAKAAAARDWTGSIPAVADMLKNDNWRLRAAGCEIIASQKDERLVPLLVASASDRDWRVRAAAFEGLWQFRNPGIPLPLANTPLAERESLLLEWIKKFDAAAGTHLGEEICEVYANAPFAEFGQPMIDKCLACHAAGSAAGKSDQSSDCRQCHGAIYEQWNGSAHGNSLSHLALTTVDPATRHAHNVNWDSLRGMQCAACHEKTPTGSGAGWASSSPCSMGFARRSSPAACASCHQSVVDQWQTWQSRPHPRRPVWPPGQIDMNASRDFRSCTDCHMTSMQDDGVASANHRWSVRRTPSFLREGVEIKAKANGLRQGKLSVRLTLVNLAGHDFPTGTGRRAVRVYAGHGDDDAALVSSMSPQPTGNLPGETPPIPAGHTREFDVLLPPESEAIFVGLQFCRNRFISAGYEVDFFRQSVALGNAE